MITYSFLEFSKKIVGKCVAVSFLDLSMNNYGIFSEKVPPDLALFCSLGHKTFPFA